MEPVLDWKYPSQYIFDAGGSLDDDVVNGNDTLTYDWKFSNNDTVVRDRSEQNGKRIIVSFNQKGEYQVQLTVRDSFGKVGEIQKTIRVES
jgi:PKD repeat protein